MNSDDVNVGALIITLLIVDDHEVLRYGLGILCDGQPDMKVVARASSGSQAVAEARIHQPSVVVMDISMDDGDGTEATAKILVESPRSRIVALSRHADAVHLRSMLAAGATGYVVKTTSAVELLQAIRVVAAGGTFLDSIITRVAPLNLVDSGGELVSPRSALSDREKQVLQHIARGRSNKEIALLLEVSIKTVEYYRSRSCAKLGLRTRADIVKFAIQERWLDE